MKNLIAKLKEKGVTFEVGLSKKQLAILESSLIGVLPLELKEFLSLGVPIGYVGQTEPRFPNWHGDIKTILQDTQRWVDVFFEADIDEGYWDKEFGKKPTDPVEAKKQALRHIHQSPTLIPIYGHRFIAATAAGGPIISFHGPLDIIVYGDNLEEYFTKEFNNVT